MIKKARSFNLAHALIFEVVQYMLYLPIAIPCNTIAELDSTILNIRVGSIWILDLPMSFHISKVFIALSCRKTMEEPNVQVRRKDVGIDRPFDAVIIVTLKELR